MFKDCKRLLSIFVLVMTTATAYSSSSDELLGFYSALFREEEMRMEEWRRDSRLLIRVLEQEDMSREELQKKNEQEEKREQVAKRRKNQNQMKAQTKRNDRKNRKFGRNNRRHQNFRSRK